MINDGVHDSDVVINFKFFTSAYLNFCSGRRPIHKGLGLGLETYGHGLGLEGPGLQAFALALRVETLALRFETLVLRVETLPLRVETLGP